MVDFHNPHTIAREYTALINIFHVFNGIYIWEFFTTLDHEWEVIRGFRVPYRRTIWVYSLTRVAALLSIIFNMVILDTTTRIQCQAWSTLGMILPSTAVAGASLLIVFRIMAIWNREKIIVLIAMGVWVADVVFLIDSFIQRRNTWSDESNSCVLLNPNSLKLNIMSSLVADIVLLLIMLIGLLRLLIGSGAAFGLGRVLWKQGIAWLLIALVVEIPPTVFICLDLNAPMNFMFQVPNVNLMSMAATRMYRSLTDLGSSDIIQESLRDGGNKVSAMEFRSEPIPLSRMEAVHKEIEQHATSQLSGSSSFISTDPHERYKAHELNLNVDAESGPEK